MKRPHLEVALKESSPYVSSVVRAHSGWWLFSCSPSILYLARDTPSPTPCSRAPYTLLTGAFTHIVAPGPAPVVDVLI